MSAWKCPECGHGKFLTQRSMRYCARPGCEFSEHILSIAKPVVVDRKKRRPR